MDGELGSNALEERAPSTDGAAIAELQRSFRGELIGPRSPAYADRRAVWNGSIDRYPRLIARCTSVTDVGIALRFGRRTGLPLAVRGGGHSFPGLSVCDGGLVIDLGPMRGIRVERDRGTVHAQAGVLLGELDRATQSAGLAVPVGSVTHTGLAGLTLGGGIGWLMRKHGLTIDNLLSVRLVTGDGEVVTASESSNAALFWGVRGGGGNFGIATDFEFRLSVVGPTVLSGLLIWPLDAGPDVVRSYRDWASSAPDELTSALIVRRAPAIELIPEELHGKPVVGVACCWIGPLDRGVSVIDPLRRARGGAVGQIAPRSFLEHQSMFDASFPPGIWVYSKACDVDVLTDDILDTILRHAARFASPRSSIIAWQLGGAVARVGEMETPFGSRSSGYLVDIVGATDGEEGFEHEREWARACWTDLAARRAGAYVNWLMDEGDVSVREAYGEQRYARLRAVKRRYDPENVFRLNQNIPP